MPSDDLPPLSDSLDNDHIKVMIGGGTDLLRSGKDNTTGILDTEMMKLEAWH